MPWCLSQLAPMALVRSAQECTALRHFTEDATRGCRDIVPGAKVEAVCVDLADLASIRAFASKALDGGRPLDVLVNNAGGSPQLFSVIRFCLSAASRNKLHACMMHWKGPIYHGKTLPVCCCREGCTYVAA